MTLQEKNKRNRKGDSMKKIHVNVTNEMKEKIIFIAEKKTRSINFIVNEALAQYTRKFKVKKGE